MISRKTYFYTCIGLNQKLNDRKVCFGARGYHITVGGNQQDIFLRQRQTSFVNWS